MHATIHAWTQRIDELTADFQEAFGTLTYEQLNWKPAPNQWSIAQNVDHLIVINETYFPIPELIREGRYRTPWTARIGLVNTFFGNMILNAAKPDRSKKMRTFPIWEPAQSEVPPDILGRFERHQQELKELIEDSEDLLEREVVICSPANKYITYRLSRAFDIIVSHEQRHLEQAREVLDQMPS